MNNITYICKKQTHKGYIKLLPRDGLNSNVWKKVDKDTVILASTPTTHEDRGITTERTRIKMPGVFKLEAQPGDKCKLTYYISRSFGELAPHAINDHYIVRNLHLTEYVQQYFQKIRPLNELNEEDGKSIGYSFYGQRIEERRRGGWGGDHIKKSVSIVIKENISLCELNDLYPWFTSLMEGILNNHLLLLPPAIKSNMLNLSCMEANVIGQKLSKSLKVRTRTNLNC